MITDIDRANARAFQLQPRPVVGTCAPEPALLLSTPPDLSLLDIEEMFEPGHDVLHVLVQLLVPHVLVCRPWSRRFFDGETGQTVAYVFGGGFSGLADFGLDGLVERVEEQGWDVYLTPSSGDAAQLSFYGRYTRRETSGDGDGHRVGNADTTPPTVH